MKSGGGGGGGGGALFFQSLAGALTIPISIIAPVAMLSLSFTRRPYFHVIALPSSAGRTTVAFSCNRSLADGDRDWVVWLTYGLASSTTSMAASVELAPLLLRLIVVLELCTVANSFAFEARGMGGAKARSVGGANKYHPVHCITS